MRLISFAFWQLELDDETSLVCLQRLQLAVGIPLASVTVWFLFLEPDISKPFESRMDRPGWCEVYCR